VILAIIAKIGAGGACGTRSSTRLDDPGYVDGRAQTVCNMSIERARAPA